MRDSSLGFLLVAATASLLPAQNGDRPGEKQAMLPDSVEVPPAPARTPAEELETFRLPKGYEARLFASEPMIQDPVLATFDAAGRVWVAEFRSYMKDIDATDEAEPTGRIVVLHDDDHDGVADRSTVFADQLILPRAVLPLPGGALVITPPELVWMPDRDGDLVADGPREVIMGGYEAGTGNPEHCGNSLTWGFDHRIHIANDRRVVVRNDDGSFAVESGAGGGQWGLCLDDRGRFYFNYNSDWLRCDLVPGHYAPRADAVGGLSGLNHRVAADQGVWPCRITPGINRGYQKHMLRDYVLARTTAVCAPLVYRGDLLPFQDDVFVCEPAGNVVRRFVTSDRDGTMRGENPYDAEQLEFLASTDERFRPVNLSNGPDGALYVVDMYRGVIQHRNYVTSFLRDQVEKRGLEQPIHQGRIWRIVPTGAAAKASAPMPNLIDASAAALVAALKHPSGTVRDLAMQQIVQRDLQAAVAPLRSLLLKREAQSPATRIAALAALAGLDALNRTDFRRDLRAEDVGVVAFALQHAGDAIADADPQLWSVLEGFDGSSPATLRWHAALALGDALRSDSSRRDRVVDRAYRLLARYVAQAPGDDVLRAAVATSAHPHIPAVLAELARADEAGERLQGAARDLARRAVRSGKQTPQAELFAFAADAPEWLRRACLQGAVEALPKGNRRVGWLVFPEAPASLSSLSTHADEATRRHAQELLSAVRVDGTAIPGVVTDLSDDEKQRVARGEHVFRSACAACHQLDGRGQQGLAPPLADSEWVIGESETLIRIALHGVRGPIEVDGTTWDLEMPGQGHLSDQALSEVLSYLRRTFGHRASCITEDEVRKMRNRTKQRAGAWTASELLGKK